MRKQTELNHEKWAKLIKSEVGLSVDCGVRPREELLIKLPKQKERKGEKQNG
jgi:hypothetical protein